MPLKRERERRAGAFRGRAALLLCAFLCQQACASASPVPHNIILSRSVAARSIEAAADPDTSVHLLPAPAIARLREVGVVMLGLVVRNVAATDVVVRSVESCMELESGLVLRAIAPGEVTERTWRRDMTPPSALPLDTPPSEDAAAGSGGDEALKVLKDLSPGALANIVMWGTSPIWVGPYLLTKHANQRTEKQRRRNAALERLEEVRLAHGEAAGGVLYFTADDGLPESPAMAALIVSLRVADTGEEAYVRLPLSDAGAARASGSAAAPPCGAPSASRSGG